MQRNRRRSLKGPIVFSWVLVWFGTILVVNPDRTVTQAGIALWGMGILLQYGVACAWFMGRPSSGATAEPAKPRRLPARV